MASLSARLEPDPVLELDVEQLAPGTVELLREQPFVRDVAAATTGRLRVRVAAEGDHRREVSAIVGREGGLITGMRQERLSLEEAFVRLTQERDAAESSAWQPAARREGRALHLAARGRGRSSLADHRLPRELRRGGAESAASAPRTAGGARGRRPRPWREAALVVVAHGLGDRPARPARHAVRPWDLPGGGARDAGDAAGGGRLPGRRRAEPRADPGGRLHAAVLRGGHHRDAVPGARLGRDGRPRARPGDARGAVLRPGRRARRTSWRSTWRTCWRTCRSGSGWRC